MIDLVHNRVIRGDDFNEPIKKWDVWFKTPWGYCKTAHEAVKVVEEKKLELDPDMVIVPVAVAITATSYEAWER